MSSFYKEVPLVYRQRETIKRKREREIFVVCVFWFCFAGWLGVELALIPPR